MIPNPLVFGSHDQMTRDQLQMCLDVEEDARGVLCADGHVGYSMPIGGVVGYRRFISPSGVGYDIACGNMAVETNLYAKDLSSQDYARIADTINARISFGMGRNNDEPVDDDVFDTIAESPVTRQRSFLQVARNQLGTVGSGNHYVDVLEDTATGKLWVACHFGSRGFGHKTAVMFMNIAAGLPADGRAHQGEMMSPPLLLDTSLPSGQDYIAAMTIAGYYAYAGRRHVVAKVLEILGAHAADIPVHNHHNFAWMEHHDTARWVVRKGATPAFPGQLGFVGGSMGDISVIISGRDTPASRAAMFSTVHGAGRVMSRNQALKGKHQWQCPFTMYPQVVAGIQPPRCAVCYVQPQQRPPKNMKCPVHDVALVKEQLTAPVDFRAVQDAQRANRIELRGAGADEAPQVYRTLSDVLLAHRDTIQVVRTLTPRIVVMAGKDVRDDYKD
jgi:tRNA-splicing ligase RtcB